MDNLVARDSLVKFLEHEIDSDRDLFDRLLSHLSRHLAELTEAAPDPVKLGQLAHKTKTGCRSFGALKLEGLLEQLETLSRSDDPRAAQSLFLKIVDLIDPTLAEIRTISDEILGRAGKSA